MTPVMMGNHCSNDKTSRTVTQCFTYLHYSPNPYAWSCCLPWLLSGCGALMSSIACLYPKKGVSDGNIVWC